MEIFFIIIIVLSTAIQAVTGFAGTALAMPVSTALMGIEVARPVLNVVAIAISLTLVILFKDKIQFKLFSKLISLMVIGMAIGVWLESFLEFGFMQIVYGIFIILVSLYHLVLKRTLNIPFFLGIIMMIAAGIIHAWYLTGGPLVIMVMASKVHDKQAFRVSLSLLWVILNSYVFTQDLSSGLYTSYVWQLSVIALLSIPISYIMGAYLFKRLDHTRFMKLTYALLLLSGLTLLL